MPPRTRWPVALTRRMVGRLRSSPEPPPASRWLVCCVAENDARFLGQATRLVQSLRWFGGSVAGARMRVCVIESVDPSARTRLESLGAEVRVVPRFLASNPFANKLQAFLDPDWDEADLVLLCDCDTAILQDPRPHVRGDLFQAKIADLPTVTHDALARVFRHYGLPMPARRFVTDFQATATIPYFNSGVVVLPRRVARRVAPVWREINRDLAGRLELLGPHAVHVNQASLAVTLTKLREPVAPLDRAMNFPLHLTHLEPPPGFAACDPVIAHYHDRIDADGYLLEPPYPAAAQRIRAFNDRRRRTDAPALSFVRRASRPPELLLTGISRSGTSWLSHLLHRFEDCVVVNEPPEVVQALQLEARPTGIPAFFTDTRRRILSGEPIFNKLTDGAVTPDTAANDDRSTYVPTPDSERFVLAVKNTRAFLSRLDAVRDVMPGARILACVRNPFDTIGSWKRTFPHLRDADLLHVPVGHPEDPWLGEDDRAALRRIAACSDVAERRARWWRWFAEVLLRHRDRLVLVRYPDLVADPTTTLARALVGYDLGMPRLPLAPSIPRRSRELLDPHDVEVIRAVCVDAAEALGVGTPD